MQSNLQAILQWSLQTWSIRAAEIQLDPTGPGYSAKKTQVYNRTPSLCVRNHSQRKSKTVIKIAEISKLQLGFLGLFGPNFRPQFDSKRFLKK